MSPSSKLVVHSDVPSLEVVLPSGDTETYTLTHEPDRSTSVVKQYVTDIKQNLPLSSLLDQLDRAGKLMFVAYVGVVGSEVASDISNRQEQLHILSGEANTAMVAFREGTAEVILDVLDAFDLLLRLHDDKAIEGLAGCAEYAADMSVACGELAGRFKVLEEDTRKDAGKTEDLYGQELKRAEQIAAQRAQMQANMAAQQKNHEGLVAAINELNEDIAEAKSEVKSQEQRAFILGIVGAVMGGLGAAVGGGLKAYMTASNPIGTAVSQIPALAGDITHAVKDDPKDPGDKKAGDDPADSALAAAGKAVGDKIGDKIGDKVDASGDKGGNAAEPAEPPNPELVTAQKDVEQAASGLGDAQTKLDAATDAEAAAIAAKTEAAVTGDTAAEAAAQTDLEAASTAKDAAQAEKAKAAKTLAAKQAVAAGIADGLRDASGKIDKLADRAAATEQNIRSQLMKLITFRREQERLDREAQSQIAALAVQLESSAKAQKIAESSATSLHMAVWAFAQIHNALVDAKRFWDNMEAFCKKLSTDKVGAKIKREIEMNDPDDERYAYYTSERFMTLAVHYLTKWVALNEVCDEYVTASSALFNVIKDNVSAAPSKDEARKMLPGLVNTLKAEIAAEKAASEARTKALANDIVLPTRPKSPSLVAAG